ncbi:hypothetical protein F5Y15DRAFT_416174 [Xylariaceae sp. FL0016]|nr:hypothetical protein F5Y15DRAFT_416174 [Xylariaceae sp. FL0016]
MPDANPAPQIVPEAGQAAQGVKQFAEATAAHKAHPGPAIPQDMPQQEGSKEERQAKAKELNK